MNDDHAGQDEAAEEPRRESAAGGNRIVYRSDELLKGQREVWIEHGTELYRLRLTATGKLYLTK